MTDAMEKNPASTGAGEDPVKRGQILAGAERVFLAEGYGRASMSMIAAAAGVSKGTLYVYFTNKEALFADFIETQCRARTDQFYENLSDDGDVEAELAAFGRAFVIFKLSDRAHAIERLIIGEAAKFPELGRAFYEAGPKRGMARLADYLRGQVARGVLDIDDPGLAADQFLSLCFTDLVLKRRMSVIENATPQRIGYIVDRAVEVFLKAYRA